MKTKFTLAIIFIQIFILSSRVNSQDFNLFNPSNELYLFSAHDEGANAFRYNPAVLGLGHRLNAAFNVFMQNSGRNVQLNETDFMINAGSFGIAFRGFVPDIIRRDRAVGQFSLGFGFGNKTFSAGLLMEAQFLSMLSTPSRFDNVKENKYRGSIGFLYRPTEVLSTAFTCRINDSYSANQVVATKYLFGAAIRPIKNDRLTLMGDFSFIPYDNFGFFENRQFKFGAETRIMNGLYVNGSYSLLYNKAKSSSFNLGMRFNFPNISIRYANPFTRIPGTGSNGVDAKYRTAGNHFSLSYSMEKRKSIIPERKKIVEITLSGSLQDYNTEDVFFGLLGKGKRSIHEVIADIDYAAADPSVKGMLLKIYPISAGRFEITAGIEELTNSLERFKSNGKTVTAYFPQDAGPGEYYISTFANDIIMPPEAFFFYGLSIDVMNYHQFLQKYGIDLQVLHAGKYKLTFQGLLDSTSEEGKEVINRMLDIIYEKMLSRIVKGRNLTLDDYLKEKLSQPLTGSEALRLGLVDKLGWYEDAKQVSESHAKTSNIAKSINRSVWDDQWSEPPQIAIIGVYSGITPGESQAPPPVSLPIPFLSGGRTTGSESVVKQLEDAFANPKVKIIVLRVDSGGGSALGSAEINAAIIRLKKKYKKKLIVSMGGAAASGGYYVSSSADKIFADDLTITGSIGVFTARPNLDSLISGQKLKVENFKRGENSDISTVYRKLDEKEIEIIQGIIDHYYDRFISAVSEGRDMTKEEVEAVAQGRVWLGTDAFNKKLIDEIGGLFEAVKYAKKISKIGERYKLVYYAVPGGNTINDIVTSSLVNYLQVNLVKLLGLDDEDAGLEIKY
ncbi:MAG: signal peptide peptidase SppA [Ignavibacteria bacterium]|nr:signal peptide peptidase SppA [Ignavibacteria bacterium]